MPTRPMIAIRLAAVASLGAGLGACLPSMPEGEREVQCWTEHVKMDHECTIDTLQCLDAVDFEDVDASEQYEECTANADRCHARRLGALETCEARWGCVAERSACEDDCRLVGDDAARLACRQACTVDFEQCAPWYDRGCEEDCQETSAACSSVAEDIYDLMRCEDDRADCVLRCY